MIRKYHNHKLQTTPWHREEEPLNHHKTPGRQIKQSNQLSLPHQDDCNTWRHIVYVVDLGCKLRSSLMVRPRYFPLSTASRVWPWSLYTMCLSCRLLVLMWMTWHFFFWVEVHLPISYNTLRFMTVLLGCYYGATTVAPRHNSRAIILYESRHIGGESWCQLIPGFTPNTR